MQADPDPKATLGNDLNAVLGLLFDLFRSMPVEAQWLTVLLPIVWVAVGTFTRDPTSRDGFVKGPMPQPRGSSPFAVATMGLAVMVVAGLALSTVDRNDRPAPTTEIASETPTS